MSKTPTPFDIKTARTNRVLTRQYAHLTALASRLLRRKGVFDFEAADLCQEGVSQAAKWVFSLDDARFAALQDEELAKILWSVAERAMRGRIVDHIRRADLRRRQRHLLSAPEEADGSFVAGQEAREALAEMLALSSDPCRQVLTAAVDVGEIDIEEIVSRTGFSRAYVYRLLNRLAENRPTT